MTGEVVTGEREYKTAVLDEAKLEALPREFDLLKEYSTSDLSFVCYRVKLQVMWVERCLQAVIADIRRLAQEVHATTSGGTSRVDASGEASLPSPSASAANGEPPDQPPHRRRPSITAQLSAILTPVADTLFRYLRREQSDELHFFLTHWLNKLFDAALSVGSPGSPLLRYFFLNLCTHKRKAKRGLLQMSPLAVAIRPHVDAFDGYISLLHTAILVVEEVEEDAEEFFVVDIAQTQERQDTAASSVKISPDLLLDSVLGVLPHEAWLRASVDGLRFENDGEQFAPIDTVRYILHCLNTLQQRCYLRFPRTAVSVRRVLLRWVLFLSEQFSPQILPARDDASDREHALEAKQVRHDAASAADAFRSGLEFCMAYSGVPESQKELGYQLFEIARQLPIAQFTPSTSSTTPAKEDVAMVCFWIHVFGPEFFTTSYIFDEGGEPGDSRVSSKLPASSGDSNQNIPHMPRHLQQRRQTLKQLKHQISRDRRDPSNSFELFHAVHVATMAGMILELWVEHRAKFEIDLTSRCIQLLELALRNPLHERLCTAVMQLCLSVALLCSQNNDGEGMLFVDGRLFERFSEECRFRGYVDPVEALIDILGKRVVVMDERNAAVVEHCVSTSVSKWIPSPLSISTLCQWMQLPQTSRYLQWSQSLLLQLNFDFLYRTDKGSKVAALVIRSLLTVAAAQVDEHCNLQRSEFAAQQLRNESGGWMAAVVARLPVGNHNRAAAAARDAVQVHLSTSKSWATLLFVWRVLLNASRNGSEFAKCTSVALVFSNDRRPESVRDTANQLQRKALHRLEEFMATNDPIGSHEQSGRCLWPLRSLQALLAFVPMAPSGGGQTATDEGADVAIIGTMAQLRRAMSHWAVATDTPTHVAEESLAVHSISLLRLCSWLLQSWITSSARPDPDCVLRASRVCAACFDCIVKLCCTSRRRSQSNSIYQHLSNLFFFEECLASSDASRAPEDFFVEVFLDEMSQLWRRSSGRHGSPAELLWRTCGDALLMVTLRVWFPSRVSCNTGERADCYVETDSDESVANDAMAKTSLLHVLKRITLSFSDLQASEDNVFPYFLSTSQFDVLSSFSTQMLTFFESLPKMAHTINTLDWMKAMSVFKDQIRAAHLPSVARFSALFAFTQLCIRHVTTLTTSDGSSDSAASADDSSTALNFFAQMWEQEFLAENDSDPFQALRVKLSLSLHALSAQKFPKLQLKSQINSQVVLERLGRISAAVTRFARSSPTRDDASLVGQLTRLQGWLEAAAAHIDRLKDQSVSSAGPLPADQGSFGLRFVAELSSPSWDWRSANLAISAFATKNVTENSEACDSASETSERSSVSDSTPTRDLPTTTHLGDGDGKSSGDARDHFMDCRSDDTAFVERFRRLEQRHSIIAGKFLHNFSQGLSDLQKVPEQSRPSQIVQDVLSHLKRMILAFRRAAGAFATSRRLLNTTVERLMEVLPTLYLNLPQRATEVKKSKMPRHHLKAIWALVRLRVFSFLEHEVFLKSFPVDLHYAWDEAVPNDETSHVMTETSTELTDLINMCFVDEVPLREDLQLNGLEYLIEDESFDWELVNDPSAVFNIETRAIFPPKLDWANTSCLGPLCAAVVVLSDMIEKYVAVYKQDFIQRSQVLATRTSDGIDCFFAILDIDSSQTRMYPPTKLIIDSLLQKLGPILRQEESGTHMTRLLSSLLSEPDRISSLASVFQPHKKQVMELLNMVYEASSRLPCFELSLLLQQFQVPLSSDSNVDSLLEVTSDFLHEMAVSRTLGQFSSEAVCSRCSQLSHRSLGASQQSEVDCRTSQKRMTDYHCQVLRRICCFDINKYLVGTLKVLFGQTGLRVFGVQVWNVALDLPLAVWRQASTSTVLQALELFQSRSWLKREEGPISDLGQRRIRPPATVATPLDGSDPHAAANPADDDGTAGLQPTTFADALRMQEEGLLASVLAFPSLMTKVLALAEDLQSVPITTIIQKLLGAYEPWLLHRVTAAWKRNPTETSLRKMRQNKTGSIIVTSLAEALAQLLDVVRLSVSDSNKGVQSAFNELMSWVGARFRNKDMSINVLAQVEDGLSRLPWGQFRMDFTALPDLVSLVDPELSFASICVNRRTGGDNEDLVVPPTLQARHFFKYLGAKFICNFWRTWGTVQSPTVVVCPAGSQPDREPGVVELPLDQLAAYVTLNLDQFFLTPEPFLVSGDAVPAFNFEYRGVPTSVGSSALVNALKEYYEQHFMTLLTSPIATGALTDGTAHVTNHPIFDDLGTIDGGLKLPETTNDPARGQLQNSRQRHRANFDYAMRVVQAATECVALVMQQVFTWPGVDVPLLAEALQSIIKQLTRGIQAATTAINSMTTAPAKTGDTDDSGGNANLVHLTVSLNLLRLSMQTLLSQIRKFPRLQQLAPNSYFVAVLRAGVFTQQPPEPSDETEVAFQAFAMTQRMYPVVARTFSPLDFVPARQCTTSIALECVRTLLAMFPVDTSLGALAHNKSADAVATACEYVLCCLCHDRWNHVDAAFSELPFDGTFWREQSRVLVPILTRSVPLEKVLRQCERRGFGLTVLLLSFAAEATSNLSPTPGVQLLKGVDVFAAFSSSAGAGASASGGGKGGYEDGLPKQAHLEAIDMLCTSIMNLRVEPERSAVFIAVVQHLILRVAAFYHAESLMRSNSAAEDSAVGTESTLASQMDFEEIQLGDAPDPTAASRVSSGLRSVAAALAAKAVQSRRRRGFLGRSWDALWSWIASSSTSQAPPTGLAAVGGAPVLDVHQSASAVAAELGVSRSNDSLRQLLGDLADLVGLVAERVEHTAHLASSTAEGSGGEGAAADTQAPFPEREASPQRPAIEALSARVVDGSISSPEQLQNVLGPLFRACGPD